MKVTESEDAREAAFDGLLGYIAKNASSLGVDAERIALYAASANAFYGLPWAEDSRRTAIKAAAFYYGYSPSVKEYRLDLPVLFVRAGLDRVAMNDGLDAGVAAAMKQNAPVRVINQASGHHGFEQLDDTAETREAIAATLRFFREATEPSYQASLRASQTEIAAMSAFTAGEYTRAVPLFQRLVEASREPGTALLLSYGEALTGARQLKEARAIFERVKATGKAGYRDLGMPAARAAALDGDGDAAIAWIASIPMRFRPMSLKDDPALAPFKDRADFQALFKPE